MSDNTNQGDVDGRAKVVSWSLEHMVNHQHTSAIRGQRLLDLLISSGGYLALDDINLDSCGLVDIPAAIFRLTYIRTLSLYNNQLTSLPDDIRYLSQLATLNLLDRRLVQPGRTAALQQSSGQAARIHRPPDAAA